MRYFAVISYNGQKYFGWQKQSNSDNTVQHQIEKVLKMLFRKEVETMGCGRTDAGVHAKEFYLHFEIQSDFDKQEIIYKLNTILPLDIVVHDIIQVGEEAHARFDAVSRSYVYRLKTVKDPFDTIYFHYKFGELDLQKLNDAAKEILKYNDFLAYCKTNSDVKTTLCTISKSEWIQEGNTFEYHIKANRFLRGMIRLLVGMMLNRAKDKISENDVLLSFTEQKKLPIIWSVPANGLILHDIKYNDKISLT